MKNTSIGLICFATILLGLPRLARAEISHPYVVDEKPQVLFGDSTPIEYFDGQATTTYYGMENYKQDYVNGYAHITFTYTHHNCCQASYAPLVYITIKDPRETLAAENYINSLGYVYFLRDMWSLENHVTDWYLYDLQFDATGYNINVKQGGKTEIVNEHRPVYNFQNTDWVAIANWFPTFGSSNVNSMAFTPMLVKENAEKKLDPVIIIPGIMGSAKKNGQLVLDPILHTYDDLVDTLLANGYEEGVTLFKFPYEWRDSNVLTADLLDDKITAVKQACNCPKVDLVAHSMSGLVARAYIQSVDYDQDVDQLIFLGTPHKGAPTSYLRWDGGEFEPGGANFLAKKFFEVEALKNGYLNLFDYIRTRPMLSVKELLPIFDYLKEKGTGIMRPYPENYPTNPLLESLNNNISKLLNSGVEITNIIGNTGTNSTINTIRVGNSTNPLWAHGKPDGFDGETTDRGLERGEGDDTVTIAGATLDASIPNEYMQAPHVNLPSHSAEKVYKLLTGKDATIIWNSGTGLNPKMLIVQLLSPIDVVVTAPDGKKIGKNFNGGEYNEIPDAFYSGNQTDEEYITILNPLDGEYKVEVQGTGSGGEYGVLTSYASDEFSTTTRTDGMTQPNQVTTLNIKLDNENPEELEASKTITSEVLLSDINKAYELGWITDKKFKDNLVKKVEKIITLEKIPVASNNKKAQRIQARVDRVAARTLALELRGYRKNKINEQAYNIIKADLEYLINN